MRGGEFAAEVDVELAEADGGWAPYVRLEDACKLDDVRDALCAGDTARASGMAVRVYRLTALHVSPEAAERSETSDRTVLPLPGGESPLPFTATAPTVR